MNKLKAFLLILLTSFLVFVQSLSVFAQEDLYALTRQAGYTVQQSDKPKSSLVIDAQTGAILWEENSQEVRDPASLTKLMTVYLVFQAMSENKFNTETLVTATETHQAISQIPGLSNTTIVAGQSYTVQDLLLMTLISSSNVASLILAEQVSDGNLEDFVAKMNQMATDLGLTQTYFTDPSGASFGEYRSVLRVPVENSTVSSTSTAKDLAILAYQLLKNYPQVLNYTRHAQITVGQNTSSPETLTNTNGSVEGGTVGASGVDGLKTGSSPEAGYNYIATAERNGLRVIEVILGVGNFDDTGARRVQYLYGNALLEHIFATYEKKVLLAKGVYTVDNIEIGVNEDVQGITRKNTPLSVSFANNQLTLYPTFNTVFNTTLLTIPVENITLQKEEQRQSEEKRQLYYIIAAGVSVLVLTTGVVLYSKKVKKRRLRNRGKR